MDDKRRFESVYSKKVRAGKRRTYFFDVRRTKGNDYYLTITESTRRFEGDGYERHKIFLYKEDFNRFVAGLEDTVKHIKTDLMPDYDYDEYDRRHEEYERRKAEGTLDHYNKDKSDEVVEEVADEKLNAEAAEEVIEEADTSTPEDDVIDDDDDDLKW